MKFVTVQLRVALCVVGLRGVAWLRIPALAYNSSLNKGVINNRGHTFMGMKHNPPMRGVKGC